MNDFFNIFSRIFNTPITVMRVIMGSSMGQFVYGILSKWYILIAVSGVTVVFWVLKALQETGILEGAFYIVTHALNDSKSIARYCMPKILDLGEMWHCIQNLPTYTPTNEENQIYDAIDSLNQLQNQSIPQNIEEVNPYDNLYQEKK